MKAEKREKAPPMLTPEELRAKMQAEAQARSAACLDEIKAVLAKHRCEILARPSIVSGNIVAEWGVGANE